MKLNLEIIRIKLSNTIIARAYNTDTKKLIFRRPSLYEPGVAMETNKLYVLRARDLPRTVPKVNCGIICLGERIPLSWMTGSIPILVVKDNVSLMELFNSVSSVYDHFDDWDEQMHGELEKDYDFDICKIMLLGSQLLENPISVCNQNLQTLFSTRFDFDSQGELSFSIDTNAVGIEPGYAEQIRLVCGLERNITVPYLSSIDIPGQQSYCYNLHSMDFFVGCVNVTTYHRPFQDADYALADYFFLHFEKAFLKYMRNHSQTQTQEVSVLQKILRSEPVSEEDKAILKLADDEIWMFFRLKEKRGTKFLPKEYMYGTINSLMPQSVYAALFHKEIVGLIRVRSNEDPALEAFGELLNRMDYFAGLSNCFCDIDRINEYRIQADYVIEQGRYINSGGSLLYFRDYALSYILHAASSEVSSDAMISPNLQAVADYDLHKGTEYIKTLDIYLKNEMSVTKTAEALFIHRSSLMKRLDKLYRLLNDNLSDPDRRLYYRICLALIHAK